MVKSKEMGMVLSFIKVEEYMKVNGKMTNEMVKVLKGSVMVTHIMALFVKEKQVVKACILGKMEKFMMVNGSKESNMAMEFGREPEEILT